MTKKSFARLQRDAAAKESKLAQHKILKENTCWDDLNEIYGQCVQMLQANAHLGAAAQDTEILAALEDKATFVRNARMMANDLREMSQDLTKLRELHLNKPPGSDDPDVVMYTINIAEQYNLWMAKYQSVIMPTALHLVEQISLAERLVHQRNSASDPSVITDVQVKEATVAQQAG